MLALCSAFGLPPETEAHPAAPFTLAAWSQLAKQIHASSLKSPAALQGLSAAEIAKALMMPEEAARRIELLLGRAGRLALELETLFSKSMWVVTRTDELYPRNLRELVKLGAHPLPEDRLAGMENIQAWLKANIRSQPVDMDLFESTSGLALHDVAGRRKASPQ